MARTFDCLRLVERFEQQGDAYICRYAWSAKLPLSILTDFEEFAVYDCGIEPKLADKASVARVPYLDFREYLARWDDIAKIFPRRNSKARSRSSPSQQGK